jgi:phosphoglycerol transferase MdoB-like AlkP superfamily enzyme
LKQYFCEKNFPKITKEIYSGWGVHDLPFLDYVADVLNRQSEPFVSGIFTLSSHHPFITPKGFENMFPSGKHPIRGLIAYTDYALKCFFEKISQMPWYKNTLFVLVADHTSGVIEPYYQGPIGAFSIPILFFDPENRLPQEYSGKLAQQIDIMPTVLHLLGYPWPYVAFGKNFMEEGSQRFTVNFRNNIYQLIGDTYCLQFDGDRTIGFFDRRKDPMAEKNLFQEPAYELPKEQHEVFLKAFLQQYSQALSKDTLTVETWYKNKVPKS